MANYTRKTVEADGWYIESATNRYSEPLIMVRRSDRASASAQFSLLSLFREQAILLDREDEFKRLFQSRGRIPETVPAAVGE